MAKNFDKLDFTRMSMDVYATKHGTDLLAKFKDLSLHKAFANYPDKDRDKIIRYVMYAYDKGSPFMRIEDKRVRCTDAAICAGFEGKEVEDVIQEKSKPLQAMIACWLVKVQNHRKFNLYINMEKAFNEMLENIGNNLDDDELLDPDKKEKAYKTKFDNANNAVALDAKLEALQNEIFPRFEEVEGLLISDKEKSDFQESAAEGLVRLADQRRNADV